jgi:hypothetical protein
LSAIGTLVEPSSGNFKGDVLCLERHGVLVDPIDLRWRDRPTAQLKCRNHPQESPPMLGLGYCCGCERWGERIEGV